MPFGKFRGLPLSAVPLDYLNWLSGIELRPWLRRAVEAELEERSWSEPQEPEPSSLPGVPAEHVEPISAMVETGFRSLAHRCHPDKGGHTEDMRRLLEARKWLKKEILSR